MANLVRIDGTQEVIRNLQKVEGKITKAILRGMVKAGLHLQRKSQQIVPVDTGNLRNSAFTRKQGTGDNVDVIVGYTAAYAIYVHENLEARHGVRIAAGRDIDTGRFTGKQITTQLQAKFLEKPAKEEARVMGEIIRREGTKI